MADAGAATPLLFVDWDQAALSVQAVSVRDGAAHLLAAAVEPTLGTAHLDEPLAVNVILPAVTGLSAAVAASGLSAAARRRVVQIAHRLLRQCWGTPREGWTVVLPPGEACLPTARGPVVTVARDAVMAYCRRVLVDACELVRLVLEQSGLHAAGVPPAILSGEAARWEELRAALGALLPILGVPAHPECFQAQGAALAAAAAAGTLGES
ncbi:MAG: hypothetical protein GX774_22550 [Armatimonadetes bacterium]|nr:hypothetical protein [Armatimonadota bacterium]